MTQMSHSSDGSLSVQLFSFKNYSDILNSADYTGTITISASSALFPNNPVANWTSLSDGEYMAENTTWALDNYVLRPNVAVQKVTNDFTAGRQVHSDGFV